MPPICFFGIILSIYLVPTPIGNLADLSYRAVEVLKECDYILCEDTRHSKILLNHYQIHTPLKSYHCFNEKQREASILSDLKENKKIALISDAGSPLVADPGAELVARCRQEGITVRALPGPSACITGLILSGFSTERFQFVGFIPKSSAEKRKFLIDTLIYPYTSICYETPHRLVATLEELAKLDPKRPLCILRELTKMHEEARQGSSQELYKHYHDHPPKGEIVLVISGSPACAVDESLSPQEHVDLLQKTYNLSKKEAIQLAATLRHSSKRSIYQTLLN